MRLACAVAISIFIFSAALAGQDASVSQTTMVDINGHRVPNGTEVVTRQSKTSSETTEKMQSINGRTVPLERVEEHVLRDDASVKVVERTIQRYDPTGNPTSPEKIVIEENKVPGGSSTVLTTKYTGDINGRLQVTERTTTQNQVSGSTQTADTVVERPTVDGSFEAVEKRTTVKVKQANGFEEAAITYRKDPSGNLYAARRRVTDHSESGKRTSDNTAEYEVGPTGRLELHGQTVATAEKRPDGSEDVQVDIFGKNVPGVVNDTASLQLKEHQIIERRPGARGLVETLSVQRPTVSDPNKLGPPKQVSETVCRGKCQP